MSLLDRFLSVIAPHACLACDREGSLLCPVCMGLLPDIESRCHRCLEPSEDSLTCNECLNRSCLRRVLVVTDYEGVGKELVRLLRNAGTQEALQHMVAAMAPLLAGYEGVVSPLCIKPSLARQQGYDHTKLLSRQVARKAGLPHASNPLKAKGTVMLVSDVLEPELEQKAAVLRRAGAPRVEAIVFTQA